jgi:hypothetical protein
VNGRNRTTVESVSRPISSPHRRDGISSETQPLRSAPGRYSPAASGSGAGEPADVLDRPAVTICELKAVGDR